MDRYFKGSAIMVILCVMALFGSVFAPKALATETEIEVTALSWNASSDGALATAYTVIDATLVTNGAYIDTSAVQDGKLFIVIWNTYGSTRSATAEAGDYWAAGIGDLVVSVAATSGCKVIGPLESARFRQDDGYLHFTFQTSMTGYIGAFKMP